MVAPYIVPAADPREHAMTCAVDEALSASMRALLHHPDFQALESLWRSVDFLVRRLETGQDLEIVLYDISAEELAADLSKGDALDQCGLYDLLIDQPAGDVNQGPLSAVIGLYTFERTPPHAELLGRLARIVAEAPAAFLSAVGADCLDQDPKDLHPLIKESWKALGNMPEAGYLGLASPRFLLRLPYGGRTEPVECFEFEEFTPKTGLRGMLWGNPAVIAALLLGESFASHGSTMNLGSVLGAGDMPFYFFTDPDGDQVALPCTERMMTERLSTLLTRQGLIPLVCMKGMPEVRLGGFGSIAGHPLAGPWAPIAERTPAPEPPLPSVPAAPGEEARPEEAKSEVPKPDESTTPEPAASETVEAQPAPPPKPAAPAQEAELDTLLAGMAGKQEEKQEAAGEAEMDPELKALLDGL
jgi:type VI secretion system protein ImpC